MSGPKPLALVTGGMRRLGAVIAGRLADAGYALALSSHQDSEPDEALAERLQSNGTVWKAFMADLFDPSATAALMSEVTGHFGRAPDLLVNNAAIFGQDDWEEMSAETLDAHFRVNLFSPMLLAKELVKAAGENARPSIVQILDQRIANPHGDQLSYTLSKQALAVSVRSLASAMHGRARVNAVAPGLVIETDDYDETQSTRLGAMMPLNALPKPESVADAVVYLASANDTTGQIIFADAGAHLKSFDRDFMHL